MQTHRSTLSHVATAGALVTAIAVVACSKHDDVPPPTPATVVMPGTPMADASSPAAASDPTASALPSGLAAVMNGSAPTVAGASSQPTNLTGGTLTVFTGTAPASSTAANGSAPTGSTSNSTSTGTTTLPVAGIPATGAGVPTAGVIGPASAPSPEPPLMGTTR